MPELRTLALFLVVAFVIDLDTQANIHWTAKRINYQHHGEVTWVKNYKYRVDKDPFMIYPYNKLHPREPGEQVEELCDRLDLECASDIDSRPIVTMSMILAWPCDNVTQIRDECAVCYDKDVYHPWTRDDVEDVRAEERTTVNITCLWPAADSCDGIAGHRATIDVCGNCRLDNHGHDCVHLFGIPDLTWSTIPISLRDFEDIIETWSVRRLVIVLISIAFVVFVASGRLGFMRTEDGPTLVKHMYFAYVIVLHLALYIRTVALSFFIGFGYLTFVLFLYTIPFALYTRTVCQKLFIDPKLV